MYSTLCYFGCLSVTSSKHAQVKYLFLIVLKIPLHSDGIATNKAKNLPKGCYTVKDEASGAEKISCTSKETPRITCSSQVLPCLNEVI